MSHLKTALIAPRSELRWLFVIWSVQFVCAALIASPVFRAAEPLLDSDFFEPGALLLSEMVIQKETAISQALRSAVIGGVATFLLLGLFRFELTRRMAQMFLASDHTSLTRAKWWRGAAAYYGIGMIQALGLGVLGWLLFRAAIRFYRDTGGSLPPQATFGAACAALLLLLLGLIWNTVCDVARVSLFRRAYMIHQIRAERRVALQRQLPRLVAIKTFRTLLLGIQTWIVLELTTPGGAWVGLGALLCVTLVQCLVLLSLWLDAAWLGCIALKSVASH